MQKIIIKYLGPVRELEMEIKDFNLLIGEQATGKSTVAKAIYFFRIIKSTLADYLCQLYDTALYNGNDVSDGFNKVLKKELKSVFISLFGYSWDLDKRLYLRYEYATGIWIDVKLNDKGKKQYISVRYSPKLAQTLKTLEEEALDLFEQKMETATISLAYASRERLRNYDNFKNRVNEIFDDYKETYYIPAGRSMLTLLVNNRSLLENDNLDLITRQFMQVIDNIHKLLMLPAVSSKDNEEKKIQLLNKYVNPQIKRKLQKKNPVIYRVYCGEAYNMVHEFLKKPMASRNGNDYTKLEKSLLKAAALDSIGVRPQCH